MRLTNVAHLALPFGRLWGYEVSVGAPGAALPVSFDQRRHVEAGDRPGSWMALSFRLRESVDRTHLEAAWLAVIARHGTLRTAFSAGPDRALRLHEVEIGPGRWVEHDIATGQSVNLALRDVLDQACSPYAAPSHRLCLLETADRPTVVVAADHAHVDLWSMLVIARDLLTALEGAQREKPTELPPAPPFAAHTEALLARPRAPEHLHRRWADVLQASGGVMPQFPMDLGDVGARLRERVEVRDVLDVDDSAALSAQAREDGVSTLALVVAAMTEVTADVAGQPLRAVFPVHSRYDESWHDSVGWFITNSVLESADPEPRACSAAVKEAIELGSWPLADILAPWDGMPEAPGMFAVSWLDLRRLPVRVDAVGLQAQYVGAQSLTDGVMLWFVLDELGLHLRCRYPDTHEARRHVGRWLDHLVARLRSRARASVGGRLLLECGLFRIERAVRADVPALVALLADDPIGATREGAELARYEAAFDAVAQDPAQYLAAVRDAGDRLVATMQLSIVPGLLRQGATRMTVEGVRVAPSMRGRGLGSAMLEWAHDHGRARGAVLSQLTTDRERERAHGFYERLGYEATHIGLKLPL